MENEFSKNIFFFNSFKTRHLLFVLMFDQLIELIYYITTINIHMFFLHVMLLVFLLKKSPLLNLSFNLGRIKFRLEPECMEICKFLHECMPQQLCQTQYNSQNYNKNTLLNELIPYRQVIYTLDLIPLGDIVTVWRSDSKTRFRQILSM